MHSTKKPIVNPCLKKPKRITHFFAPAPRANNAPHANHGNNTNNEESEAIRHCGVESVTIP